jgi:hypothetical protein
LKEKGQKRKLARKLATIGLVSTVATTSKFYIRRSPHAGMSTKLLTWQISMYNTS